jgi:hypothetical protein
MEPAEHALHDNAFVQFYPELREKLAEMGSPESSPEGQ